MDGSSSRSSLGKLDQYVKDRYEKEKEKLDAMHVRRDVQLAHSQYLQKQSSPQDTYRSKGDAQAWAKKHGLKNIGRPRTPTRILRNSSTTASNSLQSTNQANSSDGSRLMTSIQNTAFSLRQSSRSRSSATSMMRRGVSSSTYQSSGKPGSRSQADYDDDEELSPTQNHSTPLIRGSRLSEVLCISPPSPLHLPDPVDAFISPPDTSQQCPVLMCGAHFSTADKLQTHLGNYEEHNPCHPYKHILDLKLMWNVKEYRCPVCYKSYKSDSLCMNHMLKKEHKILELYRPVQITAYGCPVCFIIYNSIESCRQHMAELNHVHYECAFREDLKVADPLLFPPSVLEQFLHSCRDADFHLECIECRYQLHPEEDIIGLHINNSHNVMALTSKTLLDVYRSSLKKYSCAQCLMFFNDLPNGVTSMSIHQCNDKHQGIIVDNDCMMSKEYMLRLSLNRPACLKPEFPSGLTPEVVRSNDNQGPEWAVDWLVDSLALGGDEHLQSQLPVTTSTCDSQLLGMASSSTVQSSNASLIVIGDESIVDFDNQSSIIMIDSDSSMINVKECSSAAVVVDVNKYSSTVSNSQPTRDTGMNSAVSHSVLRKKKRTKGKCPSSTQTSSTEPYSLNGHKLKSRTRKRNISESNVDENGNMKRLKNLEDEDISSASTTTKKTVSACSSCEHADEDDFNDRPCPCGIAHDETDLKVKSLEKGAIKSCVDSGSSRQVVPLSQSLVDLTASMNMSGQKTLGETNLKTIPSLVCTDKHSMQNSNAASKSNLSQNNLPSIKSSYQKDVGHAQLKETAQNKTKGQNLVKSVIVQRVQPLPNPAKKQQPQALGCQPAIAAPKAQNTVPDNLMEMRHILFLDLDNWPKFFQKLPRPLPDGTFVWAFLGGATVWKDPVRCEAYSSLLAAKSFHLHGRCGRTKDAADFAMVLYIGKMDERLPKMIPFSILSGDKGFCELERQMESSQRHTVVINPHHRSMEELLVLIYSVTDIICH